MRKVVWFLSILAAVAVWLITPDYIWKYAFFLRVPLIMGALLVALPYIATKVLPAMLKNLFVLRDKWQLTFVIVSAVIAGIAVTISAYTILLNAPSRFDLPVNLRIPDFWQYALAIALALPICFTATDLSKKNSTNHENLKGKNRQVSAVIGGVLSIGFLALVSLIRKWLYSITELKQFLISVISIFAKQETGGYIAQNGDLARGHLTAIALLLVGGLIYLVIGLSFKPKPKLNRREAPALLYLLLIVAVATLFYGGATFYFDHFRIPVLLIFIVFSIFTYVVIKINHFFQLQPLNGSNHTKKPIDSDSGDFAKVLDARLKHQTGDRTLVVVCASGGGIQAAGWTVKVLTGLQQELGTSFTKAIGLISAVSGGSVGTMYYLDRFIDEAGDDRGYPRDGELQNIFASATRDSLDAVGWGLAYLDLWRFLGLPIIRSKFDRGSTVEVDWQREMKPGQVKTLATWRKQIFNGEIPIPVFNATSVEDGRRFLVTPVTFGKVEEKKAVDFNTLYGVQGYDLNVVTAARLSATFPYVSPICRPMCPNGKAFKGENYHVADGGYFDNSGFVTAAEWLDKLLNAESNLNIKRVLILQINPFPESPSSEKGQGVNSWFIATLGPLLAMFKVRDPVLASRNATEAELLKKRWKNQAEKRNDVDIQYFPIFFPSKDEAPEFYNENSQYRPPLSWRLTDVEKEAIQRGWEGIKATRKDIRAIKKLWHETWEMPK